MRLRLPGTVAVALHVEYTPFEQSGSDNALVGCLPGNNGGPLLIIHLDTQVSNGPLLTVVEGWLVIVSRTEGCVPTMPSSAIHKKSQSLRNWPR